MAVLAPTGPPLESVGLCGDKNPPLGRSVARLGTPPSSVGQVVAMKETNMMNDRPTFDLQIFSSRGCRRARIPHVCWSLQLEDASAQAAVRLLMLCVGVRA